MGDSVVGDGRDEQTYAIIGAAMAVHGELGNGFLEVVYQAALEREFQIRGIPYERERDLTVYYRGDAIASYRADYLCYGEVIVELKALARLTSNEERQVINYLKAARLNRGLLINFGKSSLEHQRIVFDYHEEACSAGSGEC